MSETGTVIQKPQIPTPGRIVHYFPNKADETAAKNNAVFVPAMVVQSFGGTGLNLSVFTMNSDAPNVLRYSISHKSEVSGEGRAYWAWPEH